MNISSTINQLTSTARVWVYSANEPFSKQDIPSIQAHLKAFVQKWASHSIQLSAAAELIHDRFVILTVDESQAGASGCSIDSSVNFIKELGAQYNRNLFDRFRFSFIDNNNQVQTVSKDDFSNLYSKGEINDETIVFDPLVNTVGALQNAFQKALKDSWHKRFV